MRCGSNGTSSARNSGGVELVVAVERLGDPVGAGGGARRPAPRTRRAGGRARRRRRRRARGRPGTSTPALSGSMSIWISVWRAGSSRSTCSSAVSWGPSLVPTASTTSAPPTISLALGQPKLPITPAASGIGLVEHALAAGRRDDRDVEGPGQLGQRGAGLADAHAVAGDDDRAGRRRRGRRRPPASASVSTASTGGAGRRPSGRCAASSRARPRPRSALLWKITATGPGSPVRACLSASWVCCTAWAGSWLTITRLVTPASAPRASQVP